jgi:hypothetical protein
MARDVLIADDEWWLVGNGSRGDVKILGKKASCGVRRNPNDQHVPS